MKKFFVFAAALITLAACQDKKQEAKQNEQSMPAKETASKPVSTEQKPYVYFVSPQEGEVVTSPVKIEMGVKGMDVQPAGQVNEKKGHHHVIINGTHIEEGKIVPANETHIHFGKGQTETEIDLKPGKYTLTLQFADGVHKSYGQVMSKTIEIEVKDKM